MSAPWRGDLSHRPLSQSRTKIADIIDDGGTPIAYDIPSSQARALVHRANAYPKLVAALEEIAEHSPGEHHGSFSSYECGICESMLEIARAALASTKEEG